MHSNGTRRAAAIGAAAVVAASGFLTGTALADAGQRGIIWESTCATGYRCGHLNLPMSYRDPGAGTVSVAVGVLPATDQAHKLGAIFYNPGGPGQSGRLAPALTPRLHERFDIVGFDPRGVGSSSSIHCVTDPAQVRLLARTLGRFPTTAAEDRRQIADTRTVTDLCQRNAGPLADHLATGTIARDLDRLRAAFGERKLRYYGLSYGTYLGETYANLFPGRVGSMVLDAVDDPVNWSTGYRPADRLAPMSYRLDGFRDAPNALRSFVDSCARSPRCVFPAPGQNPRTAYQRLLDRLATGPVTATGADGRPTRVSYQDAISEVHDGLTDADQAPRLATYLRALTDRTVRLPAAAGGPPDVDSLLGGGATLCSDSANPRDPGVWASYARRADRVGRGFGPYDVYKTLPCATWRVSDPDRYAGPWNRSTAPILLLGNRQGDPETPYAGARRTELLLADARLLSLDTYGHGSRGKSECVDAAMTEYYLHGTVPAPGTTCEPDRKPF